MRSEKERVYDAYLASAARIGDRNALGKLAERWHPKLLRHAWRLTGDTELAADITQEAWMDILRGIDGLQDARAFAAWAFQIVTRCAARSIESRKRRQAVNDAFAREPERTPSEADRNEARSDLATVQALMARLPAEQRAALGLFYLEGLRVAEIAVALGVAPGTIKTRLMHARAKLRDQLREERTMSRIDDLIQESLSKEDKVLLAQHGTEPGYFRQVRGMFSGPLGWVMWLVMGVQVLFFAGAVYAFWILITADELMRALRWGVVAVVLVQLVTFLRGFMGTHLEANRILHAVSRVELRQVRRNSEHS